MAGAAWLALRRLIVPLRTAIVLAVALRAIFLVADPQLSADVYRYLWDGSELAAGRNPYARPPQDPRINHPEIPTIYPPHAELLFAVAHWLPVWRLLLIGCDVAMLLLLRRRPELLLAFATFPPLLFEGAWSAHVEVAAALLLGVALLRDSGAAAGVASGLKIIPLAAVPALLARSGRRIRFALACAAALVVPAIPFLFAGAFMPGMRDYATRWIFNSPAYDLVFAAVDRLPLKDAWTRIKDPLHLEPISDFVYRHVYSDFVTRAVLAVCGIVLIALAARRRRVARSVAALLVVSPAIHPWYWLVGVPAAMLEGDALYVALALCAPFSYLLYGDVTPRWLVYALCYGLPWIIARLRPSASAS